LSNFIIKLKGVLFYCQTPSLSDSLDECFIAWDAHAEICVKVKPFFPSDVFLTRVGDLEILKEFCYDLFVRKLPLNETFIFAHIIASYNI
jgi:hypothetical protein